MNSKTKQKIAREFLIFMSVISFGLLTLIGTYIYNWNNSYKVKKQENFIKLQSKIAYSLSSPYDNKLKNGKDYIARIYLTLKNNSGSYDLSIEKYDESEFRNKILSDLNFRNSIFKLFEESLENFNKTKLQFDNLIDNPVSNKEIVDKQRADRIRINLKRINIKKKQILDSILTFKEQISITLKITLLMFFLVFILRYLFYAIRWSINSIKNQN